MRVLPDLFDAYESEGYQIATGLNGTLYDDLFTAPFTRLVRDGRSLSDGLGISLQELSFIEALGARRPASSILVIGNSFGWSTLGLALANPGAHVIAIDAGVDQFSVEGIALTNTLAAGLGVHVDAVAGRSPEDVAPILDQTGVTELDLVLVDGLHTHAQMRADWQAILPFMAGDGIVLCHDVLMLQLERTFEQLAQTPGWQGLVLHGTTSGIGVLHREVPTQLADLLRALSMSGEARKAVIADAGEQADISGALYWRHCVEEHQQLTS